MAKKVTITDYESPNTEETKEAGKKSSAMLAKLLKIPIDDYKFLQEFLYLFFLLLFLEGYFHQIMRR